MSRAPASAPGGQALSETLSGAIDPMDGGVGPPMSFFSKLKARLRKSSSKLDEGVETLIAADPCAGRRRIGVKDGTRTQRAKTRPRGASCGGCFRTRGRAWPRARRRDAERVGGASDFGGHGRRDGDARRRRDGRGPLWKAARRDGDQVGAGGGGRAHPRACGPAAAALREKAAGRAGCRCERFRQDDDDRKARQPTQGRGKIRGDRRRRHVPRGGGRAVADLGTGPACR